ncbi:MAG: vitamin B12 dependent-methionine synthase activation domain-containing protein, partial [Acidobacteriota bacterium]
MSTARPTSAGAALDEVLATRIAILDGAMGTMLQRHRLTEEQFRGERFRTHGHDLKGNCDVLVLTRPDMISTIHRQYLDAGADIIETNTFNANAISQADYALEPFIYELNLEGARIARAAADEFTAKTPGQPRFVAGSIGPTNRTLSMSPDVNNPAYRAITFDQMKAGYVDQIRGLIDGGVDLLFVETIIDALNAKAAIVAIQEVQGEKGIELPLMISFTITDRGGRTPSGQTVEAFYIAMVHARPWSVGINCALGAAQMRPYLADLSRIAKCWVSAHPNAGLPNAFGEYDQTAGETGSHLRDFAKSNFANILGGCCGTTPEHIAATARAVAGLLPRPRNVVAVAAAPEATGGHAVTYLSGLEPLAIRAGSKFQMIGDRTNVTRSRQFARLILEERHSEAVQVALDQVRDGVHMIDVNMDGMLDAEEAMTRFLNYIATEPAIARVPVVIDSVKWSVIEAGLKCVQGKPVVNSISMKDGEAGFLRQAMLVRRYGAAAVVMACDETGRAGTVERKVAICQRAYRILTEQAGFDPSDIIFDPNVMAIATGLEEHNSYAINFIEATRIIKATCPGVKIIGGISNLSVRLSCSDVVREAVDAVFLYHAIEAGLDMAIVNAGQLAVYEDIPADLLEHVEDVVFNRRPDATDRLVTFANQVKGVTKHDDASGTVPADQSDSRTPHAATGDRGLLTLADARANHLQTDWDTAEVPVPWFLGRRVVEPPLDALIPLIDWTFFFSAWELKGRFPEILDHSDYGGPARELYDKAQTILKRMVREKPLSARGVYGFWPANSAGDDIIVYKDDARAKVLATFHMLRQQEPVADRRPNQSLADFIAPRASFAPDYIGAFAVTAGVGGDELGRKSEPTHDDEAIISRALADRLAEAFAEYLHAQARRDWGYETDEASPDALFERRYRGIRPAFGYPACPDHSENVTLLSLLDAPAAGITLTESFAILPPASVSGIYLSHPQANYFEVGRLGRDQVADYAGRKGVSIEQAERWLGRNLGY